MFVRPDKITDPLYVIAPIFNPIRYRSRWKLYCNFQKMVKDSGAKLVTIEVAFGNREFALGHLEHDFYIQLRSPHELWYKENLINIAFSRLPNDWKYGAWIDADIVFSRSDWVGETLQQLQHYQIVQMFSQAVDLSNRFEVLKQFRSYVWSVQNNITEEYRNYHSSIGFYHPGFAWAIRREAFDNLGGLIDFAILGGADLFMSRAFFGHDRKLPASLGASGIKWLKIWRDRCDKYIKNNVGFVEGLILHHCHGPKASRMYNDRGQILVKAKFDPETDLKRDWQGLWILEPDKTILRDGIREYLRNRNEDMLVL